MSTDIIVLAAGEGTRMRSSTPKVLHHIAGRAMLGHVLDTAEQFGSKRVAAVIGPNALAVKAYLGNEAPDVQLFIQEQRLGTGHAVMAARAFYQQQDNPSLILYGDTPLISKSTLQEMETLVTGDADVVVLGFKPNDPHGYGRLLVVDGELTAIREEKDASDEERQVGLCNAGAMGFGPGILSKLLEKLNNNNSQGEYYLTDCVELARQDGLSVRVVTGSNEDAAGVNSKAQLADVEAMFQARMRAQMLAEGVTLVAPETVFFSFDTKIAADVVVEPNVVFAPGVQISGGATIRAFSHLEGAVVGANAVIGPYARLRPGTDLAEETKVGNFVEIKASKIQKGSKINHLSYIGDSKIGAGVNVGAGTVTCNYDGFLKHKTIIGDGSFVGSGSLLVAPLELGADAYIATGSVITQDVPGGALAFGRSRQTIKDGRGTELKATLKARKEAKK